MSRLRLGKKLQPAKRVWRSFSNTLQSKVHKLNIPKTIKATFKRLLATLHSLHHLEHTSRRPYAASNYHVHSKNTSAICIDDLFAEPGSSKQVHGNETHAQGDTSSGKEVPGGSGSMNTIEDAWKAVVAKSPQLQVDEKAEAFISKFYEDMRLQKERSLLEFQERLARST
ncbi:hypothetical protein RJT34_23433 [Clitoria ternatea]|uniref:Uncharacterized protein n=1 Tax=Clitoria ternatea TaxID=43366 RepID=A0AAN9FLN0_CLITE